jgi:hypothetical protein
MACDVDVRECLWAHIKPRLAGPRISKDGLEIRARCPVCGSHDTLSINANGTRARLAWHCYNAACGDQAAIRRALADSGVPRWCLPEVKRDRQTMALQVLEESGDRRPAQTRLRVYLILRGRTHWPRGADLEAYAARVGVSRSEAFKAKLAGALLPPPRTTSTDHTGNGPVKSGEFSEAGELVRISEVVRPRRQVSPRRQPKVRPSGQVPTQR